MMVKNAQRWPGAIWAHQLRPESDENLEHDVENFATRNKMQDELFAVVISFRSIAIFEN